MGNCTVGHIIRNNKNQFIILFAIALIVGAGFVAYYQFLRLQNENQRLQANLRIQNRNFLMSEYDFSPEEISGLSDFERSISPANRRLRNVTFETELERRHLKEIIPEFNAVNYSSNPTENNSKHFEFRIDNKGKTSTILYDYKKYQREGYHTNFYFEIDNTPDFNSPMLWRYPNLLPMYVVGRDKRLSNVFNPSDVTLYLHRASTRKMFEDGELSFPFTPKVMLAKFDKNRQKINIDNLEAISLLLTDGLGAEQRQRSVFNFVKLNQIWGGDTRLREPLESFAAKVVGCGHMNGVAGLLLELAGDRYRTVGGFDPHVRPSIPGGGHSAIEIYSKELGQWSYLDSFMDIYTPSISASELAENPVGNTFVYTKKINGEQYDVTLAKLFRFRKYADGRSRRRGISMTHNGAEENYGMRWPTEVRDFDKKRYINQQTTIYVRGRYAHSGCAVAFLEASNLDKNCNTDEVYLSDWVVRKFVVNYDKF